METPLQEAPSSVRREQRGTSVFNHEKRSDTLLRNVYSYKNYTAPSHPRRQHSSLYRCENIDEATAGQLFNYISTATDTAVGIRCKRLSSPSVVRCILAANQVVSESLIFKTEAI
jgi:hypothetical protein